MHKKPYLNGEKKGYIAIGILILTIFFADFFARAYPKNPALFLFAIPALAASWYGWRAACQQE